MSARFVRVAEAGRPTFEIVIDGCVAQAAEGDTLMVALLAAQDALRDSEFDASRRAGFCLMGACQDCWVWTVQGERLRACTTVAVPGMSIVTRTALAGEGVWPRAKS
ncbi:(2Fe-2S)-binding protein [Paraburkholderia oxyphila]|uniref:(2Fe-2S)-binding protein n=1 Tax=Paraburkholderia oxyphila TaxID=614212 RepID=UPI0004891D4D|nr:(2Fe-2S)-binding protein [Paraburkholderia oxyphila]